MAGLHDAIKATGYDSKDLETYLVRLLFCLFADNTHLFGDNYQFLDYLKNYTQVDGENLHERLQTLFKTLNTKKRLKNMPEHLAAFPYINGALFKGDLEDCYFDKEARDTLIECCELDWSEISPAIFGSLFQAIMHFDDEAGKAKTKKRREFGAHYTSEKNILKTINPLFMDDLRAEFNAISPRSKVKLQAFHEKLEKLNFFDPACGCGNFLIIAYRELRLLEMDVIQKQYGKSVSKQLDLNLLVRCNVDQFHGIDIDSSAVNIATVAMWLTDHQMNIKLEALELADYYTRIPLVTKANIVHGNALQLDWEEVIAPDKCSFIMGNPPFIGSKMINESQRKDIMPIFGKLKNGGLLDYVAAWHIKSAHYIQTNQNISVAFVSTNSLTQGEQVAVLWAELLKLNIRLYFAHRTFRWSNEGRGVAAVHCVIMGFGLKELNSYRLFDYESIKGEPVEIKVKKINPYLVDAPTLLIKKINKPLCKVPKIGIGNKPIDGGNYLFNKEEKAAFIAKEPNSESFFKRWLGAYEFINNKERWCLWLGDIAPNTLKKMPCAVERIKAVKKFRESSKSKPTQNIAATPTRFHVEFLPKNNYLLIPRVSSENREFIPIGFFDESFFPSDSCLCMPSAEIYHFGILTSTMHNAWMRTVCGRLKSDYRYSAGIVYNNFPWAKPNEKQIKVIETKAQAVLDARAEHKTSTLADLYHSLSMPPNLVKAHKALDKAVDTAYSYKGKKDDAARVSFLFECYQKLINNEIKA